MRIIDRDIAHDRHPQHRRLWAVKYEFDLAWKDVDDLEEQGFNMGFWNKPEEYVLGFKFLTEPTTILGSPSETLWRVTRRTPDMELSRETHNESMMPGTYFNLITWRAGETAEMWREEALAMSALISVFETRRAG